MKKRQRQSLLHPKPGQRQLQGNSGDSWHGSESLVMNGLWPPRRPAGTCSRLHSCEGRRQESLDQPGPEADALPTALGGSTGIVSQTELNTQRVCCMVFFNTMMTYQNAWCYLFRFYRQKNWGLERLMPRIGLEPWSFQIQSQNVKYLFQVGLDIAFWFSYRIAAYDCTDG